MKVRVNKFNIEEKKDVLEMKEYYCVIK